jgi:hypothetical protein
VVFRKAERASSWRAFIGGSGSALFCFFKPFGEQGTAIMDENDDLADAINEVLRDPEWSEAIECRAAELDLTPRTT